MLQPLRLLPLPLVLALLAPLAPLAPDDDGATGDAAKDEAAIRTACEAYVDAFYDVKPELLELHLDRKLQKLGFHRPRAGAAFEEIPATYEGLVDFAGRMNASGWVPDGAPREVRVFEVGERIAAAKITAIWGVDYVHMVKRDGRWRISQVVWESP